MNDKEKKSIPGVSESHTPQQNAPSETPTDISSGDWVDDMKQELEDYIEDQGIYIRQ